MKKYISANCGKSQTLCKWACLVAGALQSVRINDRLHWQVSDIENLLNGSSSVMEEK